MIIPVILSGGAGSRLWPLSRPDAPKPFLPLVEGRSSFALTLARLAGNGAFGPLVVVTGSAHQGEVRKALAAAKVQATVLVEPAPRDTAPAIAAAAAFVGGADPFATLLVLPADHLVRDVEAFGHTVAAAGTVAASGRIVVFGVRPDHPATTYGYIQPGALLGLGEARKVERFVEKPDATLAAELAADGWLWNSGIFLMRAATATSELGRYSEVLVAGARGAVTQGAGDGHVLALAPAPFLSAPPISFDHAVMERTELGAVVPAAFDWTDLGTWEAVYAAGRKDDAGNVLSGDAIAVGTRQSYVVSTRPRVGVVGLDDVIVVASDDAVLVASRGQSAAVKSLAAAIAAAPEPVIGDYVRHYRPWGHFQTLALGERHQVKRIVVEPGHRLSLQKHVHRAEHWTVVEGAAEATIGSDRATLKTISLAEHQSIDVPRGSVHRLANRGSVRLTVIEIQSGDYLGEDDIIRLEDDYGR